MAVKARAKSVGYFDLPAELREEITFLSLQPLFNGVEKAMVKYQTQRELPTRVTHPLLLACRQTYYECREVMRRKCAFRLDEIWMINVDIPAFISVGVLSNVSRLVISDKGYVRDNKVLISKAARAAERQAVYRHWLLFVDSLTALICENHTLKEIALVFTGPADFYKRVHLQEHNLGAEMPHLMMFRDVDKVLVCGWYPRGFSPRIKTLLTSPVDEQPLNGFCNFKPIRQSKIVHDVLSDGESSSADMQSKLLRTGEEADRLLARADLRKAREDLFLLCTLKSYKLMGPWESVESSFAMVLEKYEEIFTDQYRRERYPLRSIKVIVGEL